MINYILLFVVSIICSDSYAQTANTKSNTVKDSATISEVHKFKRPAASYILEAERKGTMVKLFLKMDSIEQYAEVVLVRGNAELANFSDVKHVDVPKGANNLKYIELEDRFPFPTKVATAYKIRAVTKTGAIIMFPAVTLEAGAK